jgi:outer membrane protein assembly factor BamE
VTEKRGLSRYNDPIIALTDERLSMSLNSVLCLQLKVLHFAKRSNALKLALLGTFMLSFVSCSWIDRPLGYVASTFNPYRSELIQGNLVTKEQILVLRPGMTKTQVKDILGTPLIVSLFRSNRWDYAFSIRRAGQQVEQKKVSIFFDGDVMTRYEADELPTEAEFAANIFIKRPSTKEPVPLQATPEQLAQFQKTAKPGQSSEIEQNTPMLEAPRGNYPPLEPN